MKGRIMLIQVIKTEDITNPHCRRGEGSRIHYLACGHEVVTKQSAGRPKRKQCHECERDILRDHNRGFETIHRSKS